MQRVSNGATGERSGRMSQCIRGIKTRSLTKGYRNLSAQIKICILFKSVQIYASEIAGSGWQGWLFVIVASIWLRTLASLDKGTMKSTRTPSHPTILGMEMTMNAGKEISLQMCRLVQSKHHLPFILKRKGRIQAFHGKGMALVKERTTEHPANVVVNIQCQPQVMAPARNATFAAKNSSTSAIVTATCASCTGMKTNTPVDTVAEAASKF